MKLPLCYRPLLAALFASAVLTTAQAGDPAAVSAAPTPATVAAEEPAPTMFPIPDYGGGLFERAGLTGDWGGTPIGLAENQGIQIDGRLINYYQGVVDGGRSNDWEYAGIAEYVLKFDSNAAGLWPGGFLFARGETYFGEGISGNTGAVLAANTHYALRLLAGNGTYLSHIYLTQFVHEKAAVLIGKIDSLTGDSNSFAHVVGHNRFMNTGFNLNPVLLKAAPYSPLGAGLLVLPNEQLTLKLIALDTEGKINESGFDTIFSGGTTYLGEATLKTQFFNQPGQQNFLALYSDQDGNAVQQDPRLFFPGGGVSPNTTSDTWALAYNFDQHLISDPDRPGKGIGVFGRVGVSDGEANLLENFFSAGIGGTGLIPSRENDLFGVGYYYLDLASGRSNLLLGDDEQGVEVFYNIVPAPWCDLTLNLQVIDTAANDVGSATVLGLRGSIIF